MRFALACLVALASVCGLHGYTLVEDVESNVTYAVLDADEFSELGEPVASSYESGSSLSNLQVPVGSYPLQVPFMVSGKMLKPKMENLETLSPLKEVRQSMPKGESPRVWNVPLEELPLQYLPSRNLADIHREAKSFETLSTLRIPSKEVKQAPKEYLPTITNMEYHPQKQTFKEISHQNIIVDRRFIQPIVKEQQYEIPVYQRIVTQPVYQKRHFTQPIVEQKTLIQPIITPQLHKAPSYQRRLITLRERAKPKKELTQETLPVKVVQVKKTHQQAQQAPALQSSEAPQAQAPATAPIQASEAAEEE